MLEEKQATKEAKNEYNRMKYLKSGKELDPT